MTLIQNFNIGGFLTMITCDTRQVRMIGDKMIRMKDADKKVGIISPFCIFGGGGTTRVVDKVREKLSDCGGMYLKDFKEPLEKAIEELSKDFFIRKVLKKEEGAQILITGFNEDGTSGVITYNTGENGEVNYKVNDEYEISPIIIAPSIDEMKPAMALIQESLQQSGGNTMDEIIRNSLQMLANVQNMFNQNDEETVSETFHYCVIFKDIEEMEYRCFEGTLNLKEGAAANEQ